MSAGKDSAERQARRDRELRDLRAVLSTREGRNFVWRVMEIGGAFTSPFDRNALEMARLTGRKEIALAIFGDVNLADPKVFPLMQREAQERRQETQAREA